MSKRPETGLIQFDDDWTGVFFRGDDAHHFSLALQQYVEQAEVWREAAGLDPNPIQKAVVDGLVVTLLDSDQRLHNPNTQIQKLRSWEGCQPQEPNHTINDLTFNENMGSAFADHGFGYVNSQIGRDAQGVYLSATAFVADVVTTHRVYRPKGAELESMKGGTQGAKTISAILNEFIEGAKT